MSTPIALPDDLEAFAEEQARTRGYASAGDFVRDLVRRERETEALRAKILDGLRSPLGPPIDASYFDGLLPRNE